MARIDVTSNNGYTYTYVVDKHISKVESDLKESFENKKHFLIIEEKRKVYISLNNCLNIQLSDIPTIELKGNLKGKEIKDWPWPF